MDPTPAVTTKAETKAAKATEKPVKGKPGAKAVVEEKIEEEIVPVIEKTPEKIAWRTIDSD